MTCGFLIQLVFNWFIGVEVEEETSAPHPKKNPGSAPECPIYMLESTRIITISLYKELVGTLFKK